MVKGPAISLLFFTGLVFLAIAYRYDQYVLKDNFVVDGVIPCDISTESCFVADCSPTDDPNCDATPYKKVELPANLAPSCIFENSCDSFSCSSKDGCKISSCSNDLLEDGEICAQPNKEEGTSTEQQLPEGATIIGS